MLNYIYQLVSPGMFAVKYSDEDFSKKVVIRPRYMAVCHADQRYYLGNRDAKILHKKLPMALIHECCGEVVYDGTNTFPRGQKVVLIPNVAPQMNIEGIYENYARGSKFLSSGCDGFMREFVCMSPDRVVPFEGVNMVVAAICEFVSVAVHAIGRFMRHTEKKFGTIGVWGCGSLSYVVCCCLRRLIPDAKICVVGKNRDKLSRFAFVHESYTTDNLPDGFEVDHAFECVGGEGSTYAIDDIIKYITPQGTAILMGVSENKVPINTRDILEKGLIFMGSSRSGREDFVKAVEFMEDYKFQQRLSNIITVDNAVTNIEAIHRVFSTDLKTPFKTVFEWDV